MITYYPLPNIVYSFNVCSGLERKGWWLKGLHIAHKQAVGTGLMGEPMSSSAEHHTFIIIHTADCLTPMMNQQIHAAVWHLAAPLLGQSPVCMPTAEAILVMSSQKGAIKSKEWAALLEQTSPRAMMLQRKEEAEPNGEEGEVNAELSQWLWGKDGIVE